MTREFPLRGASRRDFIQAVMTASAVLGLGPTRAFEVLEEMGGSALAQAAQVPRRSVNIVAGTGGFAWFHFLWPAPRVISSFRQEYSYDDKNRATMITSADSQYLEGRPLYVRNMNGKKLWDKYGERKLMSAFVAGSPNAHQVAPTVANNTNTIPNGVGGQVGLFAASAAIQGTLKALVPAIGIRNTDGTSMPYGTAAGAPVVASVANADSMVGLFSSAAARLVTRLKNSPNQQTFDLYYKAFLGLTRTADKATYQRAYSDAKLAVELLSKNLGDQLRPKTGQVNMWCGNAAPVNEKVDAMAQALIVTANAFKLGLTAQVSFPVFNDDPHPAFANLATSLRIVDQMHSMFEFFMDELATTNDPAFVNRKLSDAVILTVHGDTGKRPFDKNNWPDDPPANWIYCMSQGRIKPGWYGDMVPPGNTGVGTGTRTNWDPQTGQNNANISNAVVLEGALASILYAVANGDDRRVRDFYTANAYTGTQNPLLSG